MKGFGFDFKQLKAFIAVVETGSFSAAARQLKQTQSSVSQLINQMEHALETRLINRDQRPVKPTVTGKELYRSGLKLIFEGRQVKERLKAIEHGKIPNLRMGMVDSVDQMMGVDILSYLQPRVNHITQYAGVAPHLLETLQAGELDLIISVTDNNTPANVAVHPLITEDYLIVKPACWVENSLESLCQKRKFISYSCTTPTGAHTLNWLKWRNLTPSVQFELSRADSVLKLIAAGYGWTIATPMFLNAAVGLLDELTVLPLSDNSFQRHLSVLCQDWNLDSFIKPFVGDLKTMLVKKIPEQFLNSYEVR